MRQTMTNMIGTLPPQFFAVTVTTVIFLNPCLIFIKMYLHICLFFEFFFIIGKGCRESGTTYVQCSDDWIHVQKCTVSDRVATELGADCSPRTNRKEGTSVVLFL